MEDENDDVPLDQTIAVVTALTLGLGVLALVLGYFLGPSPRTLIPRPDQITLIGWGILWGAVAALPAAGLVWLLQFVDLKIIRQMREVSQSQLEPLLRDLSWPEIISLGLAAGVGEEMLFRGWLMAWLAGPVDDWQLPGIAVAIVASAIVFGIAHPVNSAYIVFATCMGLYMGVLLAVTHNLLVPITAHALYDVIVIGWISRQEEEASEEGKG